MTATVERLQVEPMPTKTKPVSEEIPVTKSHALAEALNSLLPVFGALAAILAIRLFLLFAVVGAFILAQSALASDSTHSIWVLTAYCVFTILPLVYLEVNGKKRA